MFNHDLVVFFVFTGVVLCGHPRSMCHYVLKSCSLARMVMTVRRKSRVIVIEIIFHCLQLNDIGRSKLNS